MTYDFAWDEMKAEDNFRKHGVDFETATEVFDDSFGIDDVDSSMSYGERRFKLIGRAGGGLVLVIYTERGDTIRIISARQATRHEHDRYFRENAKE